MATLREWFAEFTEATSETVTYIVFGRAPWSGNWPELKPERLMEFADVPASILDREFDDGFGGTESPNLCAWSPSFVVVSNDYDGSEWLSWVPRHPEPFMPGRFGGGG